MHQQTQTLCDAHWCWASTSERHHSPLFAPRPRNTWVSRPTARQVVNSNCRRAVKKDPPNGETEARTPSATAPNLPGLGIEVGRYKILCNFV
jgi:hypothetical protein